MKKLLLATMAFCGGVAAAEDWIWLPEENIISNSVWSIKAFENDGGTLTIGVQGSTANSAALTERGAGDLDLSAPVVSIDGDNNRTSWSITHFQAKAFSRNGFTTQPFTKFVFPVTTRNIPADLLRGHENIVDDQGKTHSCQTLTNIVMVVPECTGTIGSWAFCRNGGLNLDGKSSFTVYAPKVTGVDSQAFNCGTTPIDYTEWDLSSVTWIGSAAFAWNYGKGTKKFESLLTLDDGAFRSCNSMTGGFEFGRKYTLKDNKTLTLKGNCVSDCSKIGNLTFGPYSVYKLENNANVQAFGGTANFTNVVFEGRAVATVPAFLDAVLVAKNPITSYDKSKQVVVYGSRNLGWAELAKPATSDELAKRPDFISNEDCMGVYETADGVRKAWLVHRKYIPLSVRMNDARFDGSVEIVAEAHDGKYAIGEPVTLRAVCGSETTYTGWYGLPEDAVIDGNEATFTLSEHHEKGSICCMNSPKWTYLPAEGVISNRIWKLNVTVNDMPAGRLRLGMKSAANNSANTGNAFTGMGEGVLDLSGEIKTEGGDRYVMTHLGPHAMAVSGLSPWLTNRVTKIVVPHETLSIGEGFMRSSVANQEGAVHAAVKSYLQEIVIDVPDMTGDSMGVWSFARHNDIRSIYVNAPKLTALASQCFNNGGGYDDLSRWNLDSVWKIGDHSLGWFYTKSYGCLRLPHLREIASCGMVNMQGITELEVGTAITPKDNRELKLASNAMQGLNSVTSVVFGAYVKLTKTADGDMDFPKLQSVRFMGRVNEHTVNFVDGVLWKRGVPEDATKYAVIRASAYLGWNGLAKPVNASEASAAEAVADTLENGEALLGVYENASGQRVAWLVHSKSPHDPKGTYLIIR